MNASSWWQTIYRVDRWRGPRAAARWAGVGGILGLVTIILSAVNAVSAQQAIALALPTTVITIGGVIRSVIPDYGTAWRRGFKQGCRVALISQRDPLYSGNVVASSRPVSLGQHGLPPVSLGQHGLPPAAL
jgi:hypothetical protein